LLPYAQRHLSENGRALFLKGKNYVEEVAVARKMWNFSLEIVPSVVNAGGVVLKVGNIEDVRPSS
ncbi:MAG: 16S rRNA (guanine(527)-N(7))-methyltransferase RsmG, partial [Pseudorhodobacter sp.]